MSTTKLNNFKKNNLSDWVLVKETFQKPSQIYKYLGRIYWKNNPIYLNRTLSYVSKHRSRVVRNNNISIESIASKLLTRRKSVTIQTKTRRSSFNNVPTELKCDISNNDIDIKHVLPKENKFCYYNWICNDPQRTSQISESRGFICPWCQTDLHHLDSLMMHLKCCHSRFRFNLVEDNGQSIIEMTINGSFDGSYCGFKYPGHDLRRDFKFRPDSPRRVSPFTQIIFFRSRIKRESNNTHCDKTIKMGSFDIHRYDEGDVDVDGDSGRLYYHTSTCLPVKPNEIDRDSEADMDPEWLRERTQLMIDEFSDVNEGEKEILKLWNLHIMSEYKYKGDNMIRQACLDFVDLQGHNIITKRLYKNFALHLANLYDHGLISSGDILDCFRKLNKLRPPQPALVYVSPTRISSKTRPDRFGNDHCRLTPPAKRALLNSHCNLAKSQN